MKVAYMAAWCKSYGVFEAFRQPDSHACCWRDSQKHGSDITREQSSLPNRRHPIRLWLREREVNKPDVEAAARMVACKPQMSGARF
jgi:hypothetical protein